MVRAAVLMAEGFEEGETVTIVDLLRRVGLECHTFGFNPDYIRGMHDIYARADRMFSSEIKNYDVLVLPGGRPGGDNLRNNPDVIDMVKYFNKNGKLIAAMCSGTIVLSDAGVITGKKVTGYTGYEEKLQGAIFMQEAAVCDGNIITSQGPATPYPFVFKICESLGIDDTQIKERMLYKLAGGM